MNAEAQKLIDLYGQLQDCEISEQARCKLNFDHALHAFHLKHPDLTHARIRAGVVKRYHQQLASIDKRGGQMNLNM